MEGADQPDWCTVTSAGIFIVPREGGHFNCHYHDCDEYSRAKCENGTLELDNRALRVLHGPAWNAPEATPLPLLEHEAWTNPWLAEMFCDWVAERPADHPAALDDNIHCAALLFAAVESAHNGAPINVAAYLREHLRG